jgi:secondary thiamine-phosphate synthase enzyme
MKTHTKYLTINTKKKIEIVNITSEVEKAVEESGIKEGLCLINPMHITASIFINDEEEGLKEDFLRWLEELVPDDVEKYKHNLTGEDNAYAHLRRTIMGREAVVAITDGRLDFGPWEQIFYGEFDGQRNKRILVKIIGE